MGWRMRASITWSRWAFWALLWGFWAQVLWGFWAQGLLCRAGGVLDKSITEELALVAKIVLQQALTQPSQALLTQSTCFVFKFPTPECRAVRPGLVPPGCSTCGGQPLQPSSGGAGGSSARL